jgi:predicted phosphodiesterase
MRVITREFYEVARPDVFRIVPIGDVHIGARACDEKRLKQVVDRIAADDSCYWIGLGDYCDFISRSDFRFEPENLPDWMTLPDLADVVKVERDRFLGIIEPIAAKCLGLIEGNHETAIKRHYERDVFSEIVYAIKETGGIEGNLALYYNGWLVLNFYRTKPGERKQTISKIRLSLHHGFVGGKLAGAKALNMQRWLWTHDCDIAIFGHSHNTGVQIEAIERLTKSGKIEHTNRYGCYAGTFLKSFNQDAPSSYAERKGYFPGGQGGIEIVLRPKAAKADERIRVISQHRG